MKGYVERKEKTESEGTELPSMPWGTGIKRDLDSLPLQAILPSPLMV